MILKAKAFLFDLNGTIIDDMQFHIDAWHDMLNNTLLAGLSREAVRAEMYGKNAEVLVRIFGQDRFTLEEMENISFKKEKNYQQAYLPKLALLAGLKKLLDAAKAAGIKMAIGSAAIPFNIKFVLDNLHLHNYFPVVISADDVPVSKPHPDVFLKCAAELGVLPADCIVFEDAPKGVEAAMNAGMRAFVLTTAHAKEDFAAYGNVIGFGDNYGEVVVG